MTARCGLVGRQRELQLLYAALADSATHSVVLYGAPGVGKTRLATELLDHAVNEGFVTYWAVGARGTVEVPGGAFAHLLSSTALPRSAELLSGVMAELRRGSGGRPLVLGVDDAHLLDDVSADLTHRLATDAHAFVVATVRHDARIPEGIERLAQDERGERLEVAALSQAAAGQLLQMVLGGQVDTATAHWMWELSQGNALLLHEMVLIGLVRGNLAERAGVWSWSGELACSDRLLELVEDQLSGLSQEQRDALDVLAIGEPLPGPLLNRVVGPAVVRGLYGTGLIKADQRGGRLRLRLAHRLYAETVRAGVGAVRRRTICGQLADGLTVTGVHRHEDVVRLAQWKLASGGAVDAVLLVAAARRARASFDHTLAEQLARAALAEAASTAGLSREGLSREGVRTAAKVALADALWRQGRHEQARRVVIMLPSVPGPLTVPAADLPMITEWARVTSSIFFWGFGDPDRAAGTLHRAQELLPPGEAHTQVLAHGATLAFFAGRPADAAAVAEPLTRGRRSARTLLSAAAAAVPALAATGRCEAALRLGDHGMSVGNGLIDEDPGLVEEFMAMRALACWLGGRYSQLETLVAAAYQRVVAQPGHDHRGLWTVLSGRAALASGRIASARHRLREACAVLSQRDPYRLLPWALSASALAAALHGDVEEAQRELAAQRAARFATVCIFDWEATLARAWTAAAQGEHSRARKLAGQAADVAAAAELRMAELQALHDALRLGELGVADRLTALAAQVDSPLAPVLAAHATALVGGGSGAAAELERVAERFTELGVWVLAAETAAQAALLYHRCGQPTARRSALAKSRQWALHCERAQTPSLRRASGPLVLGELTAREWEVAELAVRGLAKREIAHRLELSVRTVGNHLNHIYGKTGTTSRAELASFFPRSGCTIT